MGNDTIQHLLVQFANKFNTIVYSNFESKLLNILFLIYVLIMFKNDTFHFLLKPTIFLKIWLLYFNFIAHILRIYKKTKTALLSYEVIANWHVWENIKLWYVIVKTTLIKIDFFYFIRIDIFGYRRWQTSWWHLSTFLNDKLATKVTLYSHFYFQCVKK